MGGQSVPHLAVLPPEPAIMDDDPLINETTTDMTAPTVAPPSTLHPCQEILFLEINSRVRVWDLIILVPNVIFLAFLLFRLRVACVKLRHTSSPIFLAFYGLVMTVAVIGLLRCVVSMTVNAAVAAGDLADKVLWLVVRFFLLATELSVVIFGLAFGHLDSRTSIQRVLLVTSLIALVYSCTQGALELIYPDQHFKLRHGDKEYDIFAHGGMIFWLTGSIFFCLVYLVICLLPFTRLRDRFALPSKRSFYWYAATMMTLNLCQSIGCGLVNYHIYHGMCLVDITWYLYFSFFAPIVYWTFLWTFFASTQPSSILFSYKTQQDEEDEDILSLPGGSAASPTPLTKPAPEMSASYDSTHFDGVLSPNPLYSTADQSDLPLPISPQLSINTEYYATVKS